MTASMRELVGQQRPWLAAVLLEYARHRRWFRAKARRPAQARVLDLVPLDSASVDAATQALVLLGVGYEDGGEDDVYALPVAVVGHAASSTGRADDSDGRTGFIAALVDGAGVIMDDLVTGAGATALWTLIRAGGRRRGEAGDLWVEASPALADLPGGDPAASSTGDVGAAAAYRVAGGEQTNSTVTLGERIQLKVYRHLSAGPNPEVEVGQFLTAHCHPPCVPRVAGALIYRGDDGQHLSVAIAHEYLHNDGDAWSLALADLRAALGRVGPGARPPSAPRFPSLAATLGRRTGELHRALCASAAAADPAFAPEPLTTADRARLAEGARARLDEALSALDTLRDRLTTADRALADLATSAAGRSRLVTLLTRFEDHPISTMKTRTHGDLHLGQVLVRGDDFTIVDFEGEPARPLAERRAKNSPFRDVMGMVRSFAYAAEVALREAVAAAPAVDLTNVAARWARDVTAAYLAGYVATVGDAPFVPRDPVEYTLLLAFHELERVIYEVGYEVNNRPDWVAIPLRRLAAIAGGVDADALASAGPDGQAASAPTAHEGGQA